MAPCTLLLRASVRGQQVNGDMLLSAQPLRGPLSVFESD